MVNSGVNAGILNKKSVETYTTKGFTNEGVANSTPEKRLNEPVTGITTDVMSVDKNKNVSGGVPKVVGSPVKADGSRGEGMTDTESVMNNKWPGQKKSQSAGMVGANNVNDAG